MSSRESPLYARAPETMSAPHRIRHDAYGSPTAGPAGGPYVSGVQSDFGAVEIGVQHHRAFGPRRLEVTAGPCGRFSATADPALRLRDAKKECYTSGFRSSLRNGAGRPAGAGTAMKDTRFEEAERYHPNWSIEDSYVQAAGAVHGPVGHPSHGYHAGGVSFAPAFRQNLSSGAGQRPCALGAHSRRQGRDRYVDPRFDYSD